MSAADLTGATVVVAGSARTVGRLAAALEDAGATVVPAIVLRAEAGDAGEIAVARARVDAGGFRAIVVTSAAAVPALEGLRPPPGTDVVAVGEATADAVRGAGLSVAWTPRTQSAAGLLADWPAIDGAVLLPQSDLAEPALAAGLHARGHEVVTVVAYRTVAEPVPEPAAAALEHPATVLVVTSPSAVSAVSRATIAGPIVAIGARTAEAAIGLGVVTTSERPDGAAVISAVERALSRARRDRPAVESSGEDPSHQ